MPLNLGGNFFPITPIVLPSQGIDVIFGMNWMKRHGAIIHTSSCIIQLNSPTYGPMDIPLSQHEIPTRAVYHLKAKALGEILVVCKYPDVFPEELPGMPPDRDIEFVIEL